MDGTPSAGILRERTSEDRARVGFAELFFDLVFVLAVTQLSHLLIENHSAQGALRTGLLFLAVWWAWINTAWVTNWLDPNRVRTRLMLFGMMAAGLVVSMSIPEAFGSRGIHFGVAYAVMELGRSIFMVWALRDEERTLRENYVRILCWQLAAAPFWVIGGFAEPGTRLWIWAIGLGVWTLAPILAFRVPLLGRSTTKEWTMEGGHIAERCGLFIIIALGESILVSSSTFLKQSWDAVHAAAFAVTFVGSVALWWVYFHIGAERGTERISEARNPGHLARLGYTYLHIPIVAGIVLCAVSDEIILSQPQGVTEWWAVGAILGGPALFLVGNTLFKQLSTPKLPKSHIAGLALLAACVPFAPRLAPLGLAALATTALIAVGIWEHLSPEEPEAR